MSIEVYKWAKEQQGLSGITKSVLLNLADRCNDEKGYAWPSMQRIALDTGWDRRTVLRAINALKKKGLISVYKQVYEHDGNLGPNRYYFPAFGVTPKSGSTFQIMGEFDHSGNWQPLD